MLTVSGLLVYTLCILLVFWCRFQWRNYRLLKVASRISPMFDTLPLVGNLYMFAQGIEVFTKVVHESVTGSLAKGINTLCLWLGPMPYIAIYDPNDIQNVLTSSKTAEKSEEYNFFEFAFGNGLITAPGHIWKIKRKYTSRMFHQHNLDKLMSVFNRNSRQLVSQLSNHVHQGPIDIYPFVSQSALLNMSNLLFGADFLFKTETEELVNIGKAIQRTLSLVVKQGLCIWLRFKPLLKLFCKRELDEIDNTLNKLLSYSKKETGISRSKTEEDKGSSESDEEEEMLGNKDKIKYSPEESYTYFDVINAQSKHFPELCNEYDIKHDLLTLYITGTDTVATSVSSCLLALAHYVEFQDQLYQEIKAVMGDRDEVTMDDLQKMTFLDQVYQETLRWALIVPYVMRKTSEDVALGDVTVPAGHTIMVGIGLMGRNPQVFPEPEKFNPENFSSERKSSRDSKHFLPFSGGPRNCIGKQYAHILIKTIVIHLVSNYTVATKMDIFNLKKKYTIDYKNSEGYHLSIIKRT